LVILILAVFRNRKELVEYLLSVSGININQRSNFNSTALHFCHHISILKLLLDHRDLDVNIQNDDGRTGLYYFCIFGYKTCVKELLLDTRINILICDKGGDTARDVALRSGYPGIAKIIRNSRYTTLLRIPNASLLHDIVRMIIEEYT